MSVVEVIRFGIGHFGYLALTVGVFAENVGLPLPAELLIVITAYLAAELRLNLVYLVLAGALGAFLGDNLAYFVGRKGGYKVLNLYCKATLCSRNCGESTARFYRRFGVLSVVLARFVVGIRTVAAPAAGMAKMHWTTFIMSDALGALIWATTFVAGARLFGSYAASAVQRLTDLSPYTAIALLILISVWVGARWISVKRSGFLRAADLEVKGPSVGETRDEASPSRAGLPILL